MTNKEAKLEELSRTLATIAWDHSVVTPDDYIDLAQRMLSALVQFGESGQGEERYPFASAEDRAAGWTIDFAYLEKLQEKIPIDEDCGRVALETIESVILAFVNQPAAPAPEKGNAQMADECAKACDRINSMDAEQVGAILDKPAPEKGEAKE